MNKAGKNQGITKLEILIAIVILAIVVAGVFVAIRVVSSGGEGDDKITAEGVAEGIYKKVENYLAQADLDVNYSGSQLSIVGRGGYQLIYYDSETQKLYLQERTYYSSLDDAGKINTATGATLSVSEATLIAEHVRTFFVNTANKKSGNVVLTVSVKDDEGSYNKDYTVSVHPDMVAYLNGTYVPPADPTPDEGGETATGDDAQATPKNPNAMSAGIFARENTTVEVSKFEGLPDGAEFVITVKFTGESMESGRGIGGIGFNWDRQYFSSRLDEDAVNGTELVFRYPVSEVVALANSLKATTLYFNYFDKWNIQTIELVIP